MESKALEHERFTQKFGLLTQFKCFKEFSGESNSMFSFFDRWENIEFDGGNRRKTSRAMDFAVLQVIAENSRSFVYKLLILVLELALIHTTRLFWLTF